VYKCISAQRHRFIAWEIDLLSGETAKENNKCILGVFFRRNAILTLRRQSLCTLPAYLYGICYTSRVYHKAEVLVGHGDRAAHILL